MQFYFVPVHECYFCVYSDRFVNIIGTLHIYSFYLFFLPDSTSSGGESMYAMMKPVPGGSIPGVRAVFEI